VPDRVKPHSASECPDVKNYKITNDSLTRSAIGCFIAVMYPYDNNGPQRVNLNSVKIRLLSFESYCTQTDRLINEQYDHIILRVCYSWQKAVRVY